MRDRYRHRNAYLLMDNAYIVEVCRDSANIKIVCEALVNGTMAVEETRAHDLPNLRYVTAETNLHLNKTLYTDHNSPSRKRKINTDVWDSKGIGFCKIDIITFISTHNSSHSMGIHHLNKMASNIAASPFLGLFSIKVGLKLELHHG
ncbi:hypothetical protein HAX54_050312 [Datura stramonium]|uniref:Uncharacterized protein n=1 Tax=Datura stramonium TaxID=4076 RepID=A0ABS8SWA7_DATST|nr:hypothetical protein [Datura stramonium]